MYRNARILLMLVLVGITSSAEASAATLKSKTVRVWESYAQLTERRIDKETAGGEAFLNLDFKPKEERERIRRVLKDGGVHIEPMQTRDAQGKAIEVEEGLIHHWAGSIFIPNVKLAALRRWLQNYDRHAEYFSDVEKSKLVARDGENFRIFLRLVRKKVVTVRFNTEHAVAYRDHAPGRLSSRSIATKIAEVEDAGSASEREKTSGDDSGFMWRLNSYWRFQETDGGVIVECESISLSRSIPFGVAWLVGPFVESVPRESLNGLLVSIRDGVRG